jgi:hypothetical protein
MGDEKLYARKTRKDEISVQCSEQFIYWIQCFYWLYFGVQVQQSYSKVLRQQDLDMHIVFDICTTS